MKAERKVLELAELRYRGGVAAYLEVLDAQRSLFDAELDETQTIGDQPRLAGPALQGARRRLAERAAPGAGHWHEPAVVVTGLGHD